MSKKDAKRVFLPRNTTSLNVVQNIYIVFGLVDLGFILSENRCIFFQMVLWYSLMGDRNNWWLSLFSYFLLFTLDIFFLSSDPPSPPPKKNKFININIYKKNNKNKTKNRRKKTN